MHIEKKYEIIRLFDLLSSDAGENFYNSIAQSFSSVNPDVEQFLKEKSVQSTKLHTSSTYLVISSENGFDILGYFTLATKVLSVKKAPLSKSEIKIISRFGCYDDDSDSYKIPAILIAQFSRNFNNNSKSITGSELMDIVLHQVKEILNLTSGKTVFLECEKIDNIINFYKQHDFKILDNDIISKTNKELIQMFRLNLSTIIIKTE